jgi:hypothetical protein
VLEKVQGLVIAHALKKMAWLQQLSKTCFGVNAAF